MLKFLLKNSSKLKKNLKENNEYLRVLWLEIIVWIKMEIKIMSFISLTI
jgi:hypothetical protein